MSDTLEALHPRWMYRFEGAVYANGPFDPGKLVTENEVREYIKKRYSVKNCQFEVWPVYGDGRT